MALISGGNAPYAPPATVIEVITRYRDRGMTTPFTTEVLERAGVQESLSRRTMQSLKLLELIDAEGNPVPEFVEAVSSPDDVFRQKLTDLLLATYSDVFTFADPASDSYERVRDAFRAYNPRGQQERMVTLFIGLLDFLGLDVSKAAGGRSGREAAGGNSGQQRAPAKKATGTKGKGSEAKNQKQEDPPPPADSGLPPGLVGLLQQIPRDGAGWTEVRRNEFLAAFTAVLNFTVPVRDSEPASAVAEESQEEDET